MEGVVWSGGALTGVVSHGALDNKNKTFGQSPSSFRPFPYFCFKINNSLKRI